MTPRPAFDGKQAVITGAASGIGRATAIAAADRGAIVHLTDRNETALKETADAILTAGGQVGVVTALDIRDFDAVRAFADEVHATTAHADLVMNVAGVSAWGTVDRLSHEQWTSMVDINLMGPIHVIEAFVPAMIAGGAGGHLVNVSSAAGLFGLPWHAAYSASKFGLRGVSEVLRFDLKRHQIGVHLVCPGGVDTPLTATIEVAGVDTTSKAFLRLQKQFRRHACTPEQAADAIIHGVIKDRYLIFTSGDIRLLYVVQKFAPHIYNLVMRIMNAGMNRAMRASLEAGRAES
jgi:NAD(P)-dependent dehydrogenase (short-subunit alcohol dehydrogenase family)